MIYDCFPFFNELELLEIRLNELKNVVDKHVLVEAETTHQGAPKQLYFKENNEKFADFKDKIIHVVVKDLHLTGSDNETVFRRGLAQQEAIKFGLKDCIKDDIIMHSDGDEIPRASTVKTLANSSLERGKFYGLKMQCYYYWLNCETNVYCPHTGVALYDENLNMHNLRARTEAEMTTVENGGWHFSYLGGAERVQQKLKSFGHPQLADMPIEVIQQFITAPMDLWRRPDFFLRFVELNETYPRYILENRKKFEHLIYVPKENLRGNSYFYSVSCEWMKK